MADLSIFKAKHIYFIGIGGIGMSALAEYFLQFGVKVSGYDRVRKPITVSLVDKGAVIRYEEDVDSLEEDIDYVVYTPAIPTNHQEYQHFLKSDIPLVKRSKVLGDISRNKRCVAVAGTHGKTSTCALIAHILEDNNSNSTAFVGGIMKNYNSNLIIGSGEWVVAEADEYDRSFLQLSPEILVLLSLDPDHLDIYGDYESMVEAYEQLCLKVKNGGCIIIHESAVEKISYTTRKALQKKEVEWLTIGDEKDVRINNARVENSQFLFDYEYAHENLKGIPSIMPGQHNILNAVGAITACKRIGIKGNDCKKALSSFQGIKRRFEWIYKSDDFVLIDDYAHHPEEVKAAYNTARDLYPKASITVVFQPHLYTRTRDFYKEFATILDCFDEVYLLPIYPAREEPIPGISSSMILNIMKNINGYFVEIQQLIHKLHENRPEVLLTLGASDINKYHTQIVAAITA